MKRTSIFAALLATASFASAQEAAAPAMTTDQIVAAVRSQLPAPPAGFEWGMHKNVVFLKPAAWHEQHNATANVAMPMSVLAISPENFSATRPFEMGFTIQIITGSQKTLHADAGKVALASLKPILDSHKKEEILIFDQRKQGDFEQTFFRYKDAPAGAKPIIVHEFILANNTTDSVHIFIFESPVESWDENWAKYGTPILSNVKVVPTIPAN